MHNALTCDYRWVRVPDNRYYDRSAGQGLTFMHESLHKAMHRTRLAIDHTARLSE